MGRVSKLLLMTLPLCLANPAIPRSQTGCITGTVTDSTATPIANAMVILVGTWRGAMTGRNGVFVIPQVPVGRNSLKVMMIGHVPAEKHDIQVGLEDTTDVDFTLREDPQYTPIVNQPYAIRGFETGKAPAAVRSDQLEQLGVYPDTLPRVHSFGLEFQARFVLATEGDSTAVRVVVEGTNSGHETINLCGVFSFLELPYRIAPEVWVEHVPLGGKWEYPGPTLEIGSRAHRTPLLVCESVTLTPGNGISDTLAFSYRTDEFVEWPGEVRFWCLFFHGNEGDHWEDTRYVDLGVITVPIRSSI